MDKPIVMMDLDGTIFPFCESITQYIRNHTDTDVYWTEGRYPVGVTVQEYEAFHQMFLEDGGYGKMEPYDGAKSACLALAEDHLLYFVTARPLATGKETAKALVEMMGTKIPLYYPANKPVYMSQACYSMAAIFDDSVDTLREIGQQIPGYMVSQPWNKGIELPGVYRVDNLVDGVNMWLNYTDPIIT